MIIGVLGCMAAKGPAARSSAGARTWTWSSGPASWAAAGALGAGRRRQRAVPGTEPRPRATAIGRGPGRASSHFSPPRTAANAKPRPVAASGDGADHVRLRQVLYVLRRAAGPRAGTEPPGRRNPRRSPPTGRPGLPGSDPAGPDGQQLPRPHRPADDRAGRPARASCTRSRACGG